MEQKPVCLQRAGQEGLPSVQNMPKPFLWKPFIDLQILRLNRTALTLKSPAPMPPVPPSQFPSSTFPSLFFQISEFHLPKGHVPMPMPSLPRTPTPPGTWSNSPSSAFLPQLDSSMSLKTQLKCHHLSEASSDHIGRVCCPLPWVTNTLSKPLGFPHGRTAHCCLGGWPQGLTGWLKRLSTWRCSVGGLNRQINANGVICGLPSLLAFSSAVMS